MAIVKMKRLQVLALERDHDAILRRLQHMGCLEISEPDVQALPDTLRRCDTAAADLLARQRQLQSAIDILRRTAPPQKTGLLTPRPRISEREYLDEAALASELETAQHINELAADVNRLTAKETQLRSEQAALTPWRSLDIPLELTETRWCDITTGTLPPFAVWEEIQGRAEPTGAGIGGIPAVRRPAAAGHPAADPQGRDGSGAGAAAQLRFLRRAAQGPPWYTGGKPDGRWRTVCVRPPRKRTPPCRSWPA